MWEDAETLDRASALKELRIWLEREDAQTRKDDSLSRRILKAKCMRQTHVGRRMNGGCGTFN